MCSRLEKDNHHQLALNELSTPLVATRLGCGDQRKFCLVVVHYSMAMGYVGEFQLVFALQTHCWLFPFV